MKDRILEEKTALLKSNKISEEEFLEFLKNYPYSDLGGIRIDHHRKLRRGLPEAVYGSGKSSEQLRSIIKKYEELGDSLLITRLDSEIAKELTEEFTDLKYHPVSGVAVYGEVKEEKLEYPVLVISAGASDEPVAEEAVICSEFFGNRVDRFYDAGVACLARILDKADTFRDYSVIIVVAGMDGALPSVVAGLTSTPVIAVPTSIGYGAAFNGIAPLMSMLNSCSGGVAVVNIDNGFGAACQATLINRKISRYK